MREKNIFEIVVMLHEPIYRKCEWFLKLHVSFLL